MLAGESVVVADGMTDTIYIVDECTGDISDSDGLIYTDDEFLESFADLLFNLA